MKHYNLKTLLPYRYWSWEQKLSKKQEIVQYRNYALYWMLCRYLYAILSPSTWEGTTAIERQKRQNIRRGTFAIKTNGHKTKIYCNIYTKITWSTQTIYSAACTKTVHCPYLTNEHHPWKKVPLYPMLTRGTLHKHLQVEYKTRQQNAMPYYCYCNAKNFVVKSGTKLDE